MLDYYGAQCEDVRRLLKEIDDGFEVRFDYDKEAYVVEFNHGLFQTVPWEDMDRHFFAETAHTFWLNKQDQIFDYVDEFNERKDSEQDRHLSGIAESLAKDIYRPLMQNYFYGG